MTDINEEMQYFAEFAKTGTLTEVAEKFNISQPTITRAMKKIEDEFGVPLFVRTKNSIKLNENGKVAAREVSLLLKQTDEMFERVRAYDKSKRTISVGTAAAVQLPGLVAKMGSLYPDKAISMEQKLPAELMDGLDRGIYQMIILPAGKGMVKEGFSVDGCRTRAIGEEHLMFLLPKNHRFARRKSLSLSEMDGESMLLYSKIGFWEEIVRTKMPHSRFLVQNDRSAFSELIANSVLPCFATDIAAHGTEQSEKDRVRIKITDPEVNVTYYLVCKNEDQPRFRALFER
ncbi:MAG: LysR family transcriptional regulator [Eubacterium sp.]|jgi:DNA-binding transcriptional LysR family regulator